MDGFQQAERHSIARILNQLVDQQQQNCSQFQHISLALESIRAEIRRTDENHHKEVERLQDIINKMLQQQMLMLQISSRSQVSTPVAINTQPGYNVAAPTNLFQDQMMRAMQQQQQQQAMQQAQLAQLATMVPPSGGLSTGFPPGATPMSKPLGAMSQTPLKAPPVPTTGTVTLPISSQPNVAKVESPKMEAPKMEIKKEISTLPTPSFGGSTTSTKPSIFGEKEISSSQPKAQIGVIARPTDADEEGEAEEAEEYEPNVTFQPVIPLPALVDVVTGEEGEQEVFKERCKLYRYSTESKEWKERGTGDIKVLKDPKSGGYRVVMRREQVHKLCANFNLAKGMTISIMGKNTKACAWHCHDFSEDEGSHEQLSAKFASCEIAKKFMDLFMEGVNSNMPAETEAKKLDGQKKSEDKKEMTPKVQETKKNDTFGAQFIKKEGEWDCQACYTRNKDTVQQCPCCGLNKDGTEGPKTLANTSFPQGATGNFSFGLSASADKQQPTTQPKFVFGLKKEESPVVSSSTDKKISFAAAASVAAKEETENQSTKAPGFGAAAANAPKFSFASPSTTSIFGSSPAAKPTFSFAKKDDAMTQSTTASPVNFSFKSSQPQITPGKSIFGGSSTTTTPVAEKKEEIPTTEGTKIFGQGTKGTFSFAQMNAGNSSLFDPDAKKKAQEELAKQKQSKFGSNLKKETKQDDEEGEENAEEFEPEVDFKPVIPLPDLIEVKTGEEEETVMFKERCKLYRFATETKEWKERGVGDIKILKDPKTNAHRIVMRREQTHKLCANFKLTKVMTVNAMAKNAKATQWVCQDYSEGELKMESLSAKFASSEQADSFMKAFQEAVSNAN